MKLIVHLLHGLSAVLMIPDKLIKSLRSKWLFTVLDFHNEIFVQIILKIIHHFTDSPTHYVPIIAFSSEALITGYQPTSIPLQRQYVSMPLSNPSVKTCYGRSLS